MKALAGIATLTLISLASFANAEEPAWVAAMKDVHAKGGGQAGSVSQIGDSITYTMAFLAGIDKLKSKPEWKALQRVNGKLLRERKGPEHSNMSGWVAGQGAQKISSVVASEKPEIAVIMYGTNDANKKVPADEYRKNLTTIIDTCLQNGCIPIISTIPPILNKDQKVDELNAVVKKLAEEKKIPLVDFHAEILSRQPGTAYDGTLLNKGDVHPSASGDHFDFSEEHLKVSGYALRNYITCRALQEVIEKCF